MGYPTQYNLTLKEISMSKKSLLKFLVAFGIVAMLLIFLGVNYVPRISASSSTNQSIVEVVKQVRPDYRDERYPRAIVPQLSFASSDYFERHPSNYFSNSDYFERHP
jgi:hypothetical protein